MSVEISESENINAIQFKDRASNPATPNTGFQRVFTKADGLYVIDDAGAVTGPFGAGGGGLAHAYAGYNAVGGSYEGMINRTAYMKKITLASAGLVASIGAYVKGDGAHLFGLTSVLADDNAGAVGIVRAFPHIGTTTELALNATPRWFHLPIGIYLPAGDYWIGVEMINATGYCLIAYDGSGSDVTMTNSGNNYQDDQVQVVTSNKYSIRADVLA